MLIPSYLHTFAFVWTTKRTKLVIVTSMFTKMFSNLKQNFKHTQGNCHFLKINYLCVFLFSNILDFMYFFTGCLQKHVDERTDGRKTSNVYIQVKYVYKFFSKCIIVCKYNRKPPWI